MMEYEEKLGLAKRIQDERQVLDKVYDEISKLADTADAERVKDILGQLAPYLNDPPKMVHRSTYQPQVHQARRQAAGIET